MHPHVAAQQGAVGDDHGIADATDHIRPAYLSEHLAVLHRAIEEGIPVKGYFHWTLTDNLEWTDGYCPKFGLVGIDRAANLNRIPRRSFFLYRDIIRSRMLLETQRNHAWTEYHEQTGLNRPFCRAPDGVGALDIARLRPVTGTDWRFK